MELDYSRTVKGKELDEWLVASNFYIDAFVLSIFRRAFRGLLSPDGTC